MTGSSAPRPPVRPVFPGLTITADGRILPVVSFSTLLQALDALKEQQAATRRL